VSGSVYLPPPIACESLAEVSARCGVLCDASGLDSLPGGRVYGSGIVLTPDGASIIADLTHDFGHATGDGHWLKSFRYIREPVAVKGRTAVVAVNLGSGYAHWLLEELPRMLRVNQTGADNVIAHAGSPFIREVWAHAGFTQRVIPVARHSHYACETLLLPALIIPGAQQVASLNAFARSCELPRTAFGENLYITRESAARRRVTNEDELGSALAARGFTKLRLESLTWVEQVAAFSRAKVIVAPHGAGLANLVFCQPGTRVVEFFHPAYANTCYANLCRHARLDYRSTLPRGEVPPVYDRSAGRLDIVADIAGILSALD